MNTLIPLMEENKNIANKAEIPSFVYRDGMLADMEYVEWLSNVKARFRQSQIKSHQLGDEIKVAEKGQQLVDQLKMPKIFGNVAWGHHIHIFSHCKSLDEALLYK